MIQRIQTLYLVLVFLLTLFLVYNNPIYAELTTISESKTITTQMKFWSQTVDNSISLSPDVSYKFLNLILISVVISLSIYSIFLYKRRKKQLKIVVSAIFTSILILMIFILDYLMVMSSCGEELIANSMNLNFNWMVGVVVLLILAYRSILSDEKTLKGIDRIR
jgi:hypothetical protein